MRLDYHGVGRHEELHVQWRHFADPNRDDNAPIYFFNMHFRLVEQFSLGRQPVFDIESGVAATFPEDFVCALRDVVIRKLGELDVRPRISYRSRPELY